jgi:hypothetical protein
VRVVGGLIVTAAAVLIVAALLSRSSTPRGCVQATFPSATGAGMVLRCGRAARELCRSVTGQRDRSPA